MSAPSQDAVPPQDGAPPPAPPSGLKAVEIAAKGDPSPAAAMAALAYYMGDEPPPGDEDVLTLDLDFGRRDGVKVRHVFRGLGAEELDRCTRLAADAAGKFPEMADLGVGFIRWSYVFAYACVEPNLGAALTARRQKAQDAQDEDLLRQLSDTAGLVRVLFRKRAGVLQHAAFEIEKLAKLGDSGADSVSVVEVEAGKASS